jgi:SAM-dependent methyltransferase
MTVTPDPEEPIVETAETIPPREKRLEPLDDLVLEEDLDGATVDMSAIAPVRDKEPSRPSKKERTRPKITLRIPDDEVSRPEPPKPEPMKPERITRPDLADGTDVLIEPTPDPIPRVSARTPLPPRLETEEIEVSIPSGPFVNVEEDPSEPAIESPTALPAVTLIAPREPVEFETLNEGPFAPDAEEDSWTPWQPTAVDAREAAESRARALASEAELEELDVPAPEDGELIPIDSEEDDNRVSNPPEIEVEDVLVVEEPVALPPVRPRASSVPHGLPPMRPPYTTPTSIGMESIPPDPSTGSNGPATVPQVPPAVHSAPQLHQVLAEGGPRVGAAQASTSVAELKPDGKKRTKPWWEELFNDDFLRTSGTITDAEIATEANFIEDSLGVAKGATVLDLACGTGRHAIELGRRGYQVIGFDLSLSMLARASDEAQERGQKLNFVQGDMREMTFEDAFDGIYCWQTSFGYFEEEKNAAVIGRVHRALRKGGQFLLDVVNRDYVAREAPSLVWFEGDGCICMDEMQMDFITSRLRVKRTMMIDDGRSKEIEYSVRAYSLHELGKMLHDAGFRVAEVTGKIQTPGVFFGCESPRIVILAEKR